MRRTGAIPQLELTDRLALARKHAGLGQDELAEQMGVSRQSISSWERGYAKPKRPMIYMWADVCGVDQHWLIWGEPPPDDDEEAPPAGLEPATLRLTAGFTTPGDDKPSAAELLRFRKHFTAPVLDEAATR